MNGKTNRDQQSEVKTNEKISNMVLNPRLQILKKPGKTRTIGLLDLFHVV